MRIVDVITVPTNVQAQWLQSLGPANIGDRNLTGCNTPLDTVLLDVGP